MKSHHGEPQSIYRLAHTSWGAGLWATAARTPRRWGSGCTPPFDPFPFCSQFALNKRGAKLIRLISDLPGIAVPAARNKALALK